MGGRHDSTATMAGTASAGVPLLSRFPWLVLASLAILAAAALAMMHAFTPVEVNDTRGYAEFDFGSLSAALGARRTPGYPLFLRGMRLIAADYAIVPVGHFVIFCGGVALMHAGLLAQGGSRASSPWIAGSLFSAYILGRYVSTVATDTMAAALGLAACGALMLWTAGRSRGWLWGTVMLLSVAAAWLVRPVMLSLVPFAMIAAPLLVLRRRGSGAAVGALLGYFVMAAVLTVLPVLAWCGIRYWIVDKFAIVSFGGYNLIGVAGQFLDEELLPRLPDDLRPLAAASLQRRAALPDGEIALQNDPVLRYSRMEANYDVTIWKVFVPAAAELYGRDEALTNSRLKDLGLAIVRLRPGWYGIWLGKAARQALRISCQELVGNPVTGILVVLTIVATVLGILRSWRNPQAASPRHPSADLVPLLFVLAVLYASLNLLLVIVVCPPLGRLSDGACVLFPALISAIFLDRIERLLPRDRAAG